MRTRRESVIAAVAAVALVVGGCSGSPTPESAQGDGSRVGTDENGKAGKNKKKNKKGARNNAQGKGKAAGSGKGNNAGPAGGAGGRSPEPTPASGGAAAAPEDSFASNGPPSPVDPSLARRSSSMDDPRDDAQKEGVVPAYGEMVRVEVQGLGEQFEMRLRFGGGVPERTESDKTTMVIGFGISAGGNDTYGFTAQMSQDGWKAYAGAKHKARKFPGQFLVEGDTIVMRVPWRFIDGPREFRWQATSTWFRSVANTTHYAFDMVPNERSAQFPN